MNNNSYQEDFYNPINNLPKDNFLCNKWTTSIEDPNKDKVEDLIKCIKDNNIIDKVTNNPDKTIVNLPNNNKLKDNNNKSNLNPSPNKNLLLKCNNNNNLNNNNKVNLLP